MSTLTEVEVQALDAILSVALAKSADEDDGDPIYHDVDLQEVAFVANEVTKREVLAGLEKRGLIMSSEGEDTTGATFEHVCITPEGLSALQSMKGVH